MNPSGKATALSTDLNNFIYGVSRRNTQNTPELTKIGIKLLKSFPAARDAVLEYFAMVFNDAVNVSISQSDYENDPNATGLIDSVSMIGPELCSLGETWAPFIAPWSISLIVDIASKKSNIPNVKLQNTEPIRLLLDVTTQNLTLLQSEEKAKCVDMLLDSRCAWAVGRAVRGEPELVSLVAPRALALGPESARELLAQLAHYAPALEHLKKALHLLFNEAIKGDGKAENQRDVIPYLVNLASKSDIVLKAFTQDIEQTLTEGVVQRLSSICSVQRNSPEWESIGPGSLVALLLRADVSCLLLLLTHAHKNLFCRQLLEHLLQKLEYENVFPEESMPLLQSATKDIHIVREKLLDGTQLEQHSVARILILICSRRPAELVSTCSWVLQHARSQAALALLVRVVRASALRAPARGHVHVQDAHVHLCTAVQQALRDAELSDKQIKRTFIEGSELSDQKTYMHHFCLNIITLLRWENSNRVPALSSQPFGRAVESAVCSFGRALRRRADLLRPNTYSSTHANELQTCHALAQVLDRVDMSGSITTPPSVESILVVVHATVNYFFRCIHEEDIMKKLRGVQTACRLLRKLCLHSKLARAVALRDLLETALFREEKAFSSKTLVANTVGNESDWSSDHLLIHLNQRHGLITQLSQSHTSVFHAGIIGKGARKQTNGNQNNSPSIMTTNNELLMGALMSCMDGNTGIVEGATAVSLLLVELVSPDVMYNGLPWPDEDFTKQVSIERELYIRAALSGCTVARAALRRSAAHRPALCLASALLRACAATTLHRLRAHLDRHIDSLELKQERGALTELLSTMTLGQLLPHPLCHMLELAPHLTGSEILHVVRDCLWNYTRDHVPSPALFTCDSTGLHWRDPSTCKPPAIYTDTLRIIIQKKISTLGHLYPIMFLDLEKDVQN